MNCSRDTGDVVKYICCGVRRCLDDYDDVTISMTLSA